MTENISVHSGKHFEYLLEQTVFDGEMADRKSNMEDRPDADPCRFDVLKIGEGEDVDVESHHDVDMNTNIRFINQEQQMIDREEEQLLENGDVDKFDWDGRGDDSYRLEEELQRHYQKLEEDYSNLECANLVDSLDCTNEHAQYNNVKLQGVFSSKVDTGSKIDEVAFESNSAAFIENEIETKENFKSDEYTSKPAKDAEKDLNPKPGFRYKEPVAKFIAKNRIKVGKKSQGSYYQKFLMEKKGTTKNEVSAVKGHDTRDYSDGNDITRASKYEGLHGEYQPNTQQYPNDETIVQDGMNLDHQFVIQKDAIRRDPQRHGTSSETGGYLSELKYLRESVEISRLEDLIKEEELNLTNNVLDMSASQSKDIYDVSTQMPNKNTSTSFLHEHQHQNRGIGFELYNLSNTQINQSSKITSEPLRKDDHPKNSSYAERHYLNIDKQNVMPNDTTASYAAQHLDRKKEASYKKYSLKDYKALNKDVKLQRSLGPDKSSDVYLEKKAKADKLKDYASAVATYNRQRMVVKKAKSAPAPTIRDRLLESKRAAALEYSKKVKSSQLPRKSLKDIEKRRCSEQSGQLSALEIMKQRHESERLAVEEMRQNLANILKEVKS